MYLSLQEQTIRRHHYSVISDVLLAAVGRKQAS